MSVLVIAPHPDDEVLGCGGTIAELVHQNRTVVGVVILCAMRAYDHRYSKAVYEKNLEEIAQAKAVLGYGRSWVGEFLDERLEEKKIEALEFVEQVMKEWSPEILFVPFHGDLNQDHRTASWIGAVVSRPPAVKTLFEYEIPGTSEYGQSERFEPNWYVPFGDVSAQKKINALECYEQEKREAPHLRSLVMVHNRMRIRASEIHAEGYAEAFRLVRTAGGVSV